MNSSGWFGSDGGIFNETRVHVSLQSERKRVKENFRAMKTKRQREGKSGGSFISLLFVLWYVNKDGMMNGWTAGCWFWLLYLTELDRHMAPAFTHTHTQEREETGEREWEYLRGMEGLIQKVRQVRFSRRLEA
jgi:hypothetical protein